MRSTPAARLSLSASLLALSLVASPASHAATPAARSAEASVIILDRITASKPLPNGIELHSKQAILQITALRDDLLRVRIGATGVLPEDASWAVLPAARTATVPVTPESTPETLGFSTKKLHVKIQRQPLRITVTDNTGAILSDDFAARPIEFHGKEFRVYKQSPEDEHYFGLGDKPGPLDRRNQAFTDWNTDAYGWQESTDPIYKSIPFVLTFRKGIAGGLFFDNTFRSSFDFNKEERDAWSFGAPSGPLDYYILYGPTAKEVLSEWAWLTGATPLPPLWTLGFQQSRYSYYPESDARRIVDTLRKDKIPADAIYLDIDYQYKNRPFTVDPERFPHFDQMLKDFTAQNIHTILITDLHIANLPNAGYKPYDEGHAGNHFVHNPDGSEYTGPVWPGPSVFPDFTQKTSRDWWGTLYTDFAHRGVSGFWNDMNEPSVFERASKTMPDDVVHRIDDPETGFTPRTATHLEIHNVYGMKNSQGTFEGLQKIAPDTRPFVLTRASYAGGQRYAATWTGDNSSTWNHLRQTTPQLLNLGLSGFALAGADVGGFAGSPQPDLLTKWLELAAFQPIDRDHTSAGTYPQEPWENGTTTDLNIRRRFIEERYRLMTYLYTTAEEMSRTGLPIVRPLFVEFPRATTDLEPLDLATQNEFLFGPDLLVAPSPYPDERDDYPAVLPPVGWYNWWTGEALKTGVQANRLGNDNISDADLQITLHPSLDTVPVFARAGSIIPVQPLTQSTTEKPVGPLTLRVYPPMQTSRTSATTPSETPCEGSLYLDDGLSYAYKQGNSLRQKFTCAVTRDTTGHPTAITVTIGAHEGPYQPWWTQYQVEIYNATQPATSATANGTPIPTTYDSEHHHLTAVIPDANKATELSVTY
jgi:alpha-glucosidase